MANERSERQYEDFDLVYVGTRVSKETHALIRQDLGRRMQDKPQIVFTLGDWVKEAIFLKLGREEF